MTIQDNDDRPAPKAVPSGTDDASATEANRFFSLLRQKTEDLVDSGIREGHARGWQIWNYGLPSGLQDGATTL